MKSQLQTIKSFHKQDGYIKFNKTHILFYDSEIFVQIPCKSKLNITLEASTLLNLFENNMDFASSMENNNALFQSNGMDVLLPAVDVDFENLTDVKFNKLPHNFMQALDFCAFSVSNNSSDGLLTCFYIHNNIYSCDNFRITEYVLSEKISSFLITNIFYKRIKHIKWTHYFLSNNSLYFKYSNVCIKTAVVNDNYIDIENMLDAKGHLITEDLERLKTLVEHASFLIPTNKKSREESITLIFNEYDIHCINKQAKGSSDELIKSFTNYRSFLFKVNPHLFNDIVGKSNKLIVGENVLLFSGENFRHALCTEE